MNTSRSHRWSTVLLAAAVAATSVLGASQARAPQPDQPLTMRVDYVHSGDARSEHFALERVALEGPWPGSMAQPLDESNLGRYFVRVIDRATNRVLYSRGFASIYGEWETTDEANEVSRAFQESVRFPAPSGPVQVVLSKRDPQNAFREVWSIVVDPGDAAVDRAPAPAAARVWAVMENGPSRDRVDLLLVGDGYTAGEMGKWHDDAKRLATVLFAVSPFKERRQDFNVWALDVASDASGVARPSDRVARRSAVRAAYDAFGSERYVLTFDNARLRELASAAPYEFLEIVVNDRKYGGGGIHNLYATVAADNAFTPYVFVHEFGHHFAGLADEYYTSDVAYGPDGSRPEPWEKNVTADPRARKWADLLTPGVALPTPWPKEEFEARQRDVQAKRREIRRQQAPEERMEALFREERDFTSRLLGTGAHAGVVGAFEGALYQARGYYRPQADCIMFTRDEVGFCAVCRRAIEQVIDMYSRAR